MSVFQPAILHGKEEARIQVVNSLGVPGAMEDISANDYQKQFPHIAVVDDQVWIWSVANEEWFQFAGAGSIIYNTRAELLAKIAGSTLQAGAQYVVTDRGDNGILLKAASTNKLFKDGIRFMLCPTTYATGLFGGIQWKGVWHDAIDPDIDDHVIYGGSVWKSVTGNTGAAVDEVSLDAVNWLPISKASFVNNEYTQMLFGVSYDITNDWVEKQWDGKGNITGKPYYVPYGYNFCDATDWNMATCAVGFRFENNRARSISNNVNAGGIYNNTVLEDIRSNYMPAGEISVNIGPFEITFNKLTAISNNTCIGAIYNNSGSVVADNSNKGNIADNLVAGDIVRNSNHGSIDTNTANVVGISDNSNKGNISSNDNVGSIQGNSNLGDIFANNNAGDISLNANSNAISINSNAGQIVRNQNSGMIGGNSNAGAIEANSNMADISDNSHPGDIAGNTNLGIISNNTGPSTIALNSNVGDIDGNANTGVLQFNSNLQSINNNTANVTAIELNTNAGGIINNDNVGQIFRNKNNGQIDNNTSTITDIMDNSNNGDISSNGAASGTVSITVNINNGYISNAAHLGNVFDPTVNK